MTSRRAGGAWPLAAGLLCVALAGCSSAEEDVALPDFTPSESASATPTAGATSATSAPTVPAASATASATNPAVEGAELVEVRGTAPKRQPDLQVHQDYVAFWATDMAALARSDPAYKPLLARVVGRQRTDTVRLLTDNKAAGQVVTGTISIRPQVLAVTAQAATVADCVDLSGTQVLDADGKAVEGSRGTAKNSYISTMRLISGRWRVSNIDVQVTASCG